MPTHTFQSAADFYEVQDRLTEDQISLIEFDFNSLTLTYGGDIQSDVDDAITATANGDPVPSTNPVQLSTEIESLSNRTTAIEDGIEGLGDTYHDSVSQAAVTWRNWGAIPGIGNVVVGTDIHAGKWIFSASMETSINGRALGLRILKGNTTVAGNSVDGSSRLNDSFVNVSHPIEVQDGDVIKFFGGQDITSNSSQNKFDVCVDGIRIS